MAHIVGHKGAMECGFDVSDGGGMELLVAVGAPNDERHLVLVAEHIARWRVRHVASAFVAIIVNFLTVVAEIHHHGIFIAVQVEDVPHHGIVVEGGIVVGGDAPFFGFVHPFLQHRE